MRYCAHNKVRRQGTAAVEFAFCFPLVLFILAGLWEVGRITEVSNVMMNSAREAARDASLGQDTLSTVASNLLTYLQSAEPTAFGQGHTTKSMSSSAYGLSLAANTTGITYIDTTVSPNRELFTVTFTDLTTPSTTDPTGMAQLDQYQISVQVPYASIAWSPIPQITGTSRISVTTTWVCMVDSPFTIPGYLPAQ
jgi:Flp pilus assembly protein TadG